MSGLRGVVERRRSIRMREGITGILRTTPSSGLRLPGIEGARAIAAGSILVSHVWFFASPDGTKAYLGPFQTVAPDLDYGVVLFFALSGFLLYWPFAAAILRRTDAPNSRRYFRNRALRILPAYWVILLVSSVVLQSAVRPDGTHGTLFDPLLLGQSMLFVQHYDPGQILTGIGPAWSLNVEIVFYLLLPLLGFVGIALRRRGHDPVTAALVPAMILLVLGLAGKGVAKYVVPPEYPFAGWESDWHSVIERSFVCQADLFAFGMALGVARVLWEDGTLRLPTWWRLPAGVAATATLAFVAVWGTNGAEHLSYSPWNTVVALVFAVLLSLVVLVDRTRRRSGLLVRTLEWRPLVGIGVVSYGVFLWHGPLILALRDWGLTFPGQAGFLANLAIIGSVTVLLSIVTYRLVEEPCLRRRARPRHMQRDLEPLASAAEQAAAP
jgi:peptidoglycan/LPS O-acetylase OafA/YrhL